MKKQAYSVIAMFILVGSMAVAAQAQSSGGAKLIANIPFEFNVGNKTLPAGEYTVTQVNPSSDQAILQIRNQDGSVSAMVQMTTAIGKATESAKLIFNRYGDRYFFAQAWIDGNDSGLRAAKPAAERVVERELAGNRPRTETVALTQGRAPGHK
jgi:hypothetical protein